MKKNEPRNTVKFLRKALKDLDDSVDYVQKNVGEEDATKLASKLFNAVDRIAENPANSGRPGRIDGTREMLVSGTKYLIPFRYDDESVEILRVFHTSRKPPNQRW